jgi:hypothetical protein
MMYGMGKQFPFNINNNNNNTINNHDNDNSVKMTSGDRRCGSYPSYLESSNVFQNLRRIAFRFYLLFQHHVTPELAVQDGYIGVSRKAYSQIRIFGPETAIACVDARAERTREQVVSPESWNDIFTALHALPASIQHVVMVTGVPVVYPRMESADTVFETLGNAKKATNKAFNKVTQGLEKGIGKLFGDKSASSFHESMDSLKMALGKSGMMKKVLNQFGEVELADDLIGTLYNDLKWH